MTIYSLDELLPQFGTSCSISSPNCCFLTCIQVSQKAGKVVWYSLLLKNFPQFVVICTVKGFSVVYEATSSGVHSDSRPSSQYMLSCFSMHEATLCKAMDCSPPGFSVHGDSPGKSTGVGILYHASNLDWSSISHMVIYMFQ